MTTQEKTLKLIQTFGYNSRQVAEVLEISTRLADKKIKKQGYEKFTNEQVKKLFEHFEKLNEEQKQILEKFKAI